MTATDAIGSATSHDRDRAVEEDRDHARLRTTS